MMQGDSYGLPITILKKKDNVAVTPDDVSDVEIVIGPLTKTYANNEVTFDSNTGKWVFHLTQDETFKFPATRVKAQVRVAWKNGCVNGYPLGYINVLESISKEVL